MRAQLQWTDGHTTLSFQWHPFIWIWQETQALKFSLSFSICPGHTHSLVAKIIRTLELSPAKNVFKSVIYIFCCSVSIGNISLHFQTFILPLIAGVSKLLVALSIKNALSILKSELGFFPVNGTCAWETNVEGASFHRICAVRYVSIDWQCFHSLLF